VRRATCIREVRVEFPPVTLQDFKATVDANSPPEDLSPALRALWHDARGDWQAAHEVAQAIEDETGAWVHAYLHRKEGDASNAVYWYRRAGKPVATDALAVEWDRIASALLA
jgi:hypothetical protein